MGNHLCKTGLALLVRTIAGALLGAAGGLIFGLLFGMLDGLMQQNLERIVLDGANLALCGAAAGAILGAYGQLIEGEWIRGFSEPWVIEQRVEIVQSPARNRPATRSVAAGRNLSTQYRFVPRRGRKATPSA